MFPALTLSALVLLSLSAGAVEPDKADIHDSLGAYYNYCTWDCSIKDGRYKLRTKAHLTIVNPRGDDYASVVAWEDSYQRLKDVRIKVFDAEGKKVYSRMKKDMLKACGYGPSYVLYTDDCQYWISLPGPGYPYSIEYEYETESSTLFFWSGARLQRAVPTRHVEYCLECPSDFVFHYKTYGVDVEPDIEHKGKRVVYRWITENVPAQRRSGAQFLPPEVRAPARLVLVPEWFELDGYVCDDWSWNAIADWYRQLTHDRYLAAETLSTIYDHIVEEPALVCSLYSMVTSNTRYIAVHEGVGGWQPHEAVRTRELGYGDCKDLTTLLISYLRTGGIDAYPVLVLTRSAGRLDVDFPLKEFNHVICMAVIGNDTIWMDPTCFDCPFGDLPLMDEDIDALVITDQAGAIVRTPGSTATNNTWRRNTRVHVEPDYRIRIESQWTLTGNSAHWLVARFRHADHDDRLRWVTGLFRGGARAYRITSQSLSPTRDDYGNVTIHVSALSHSPVRQMDQSLRFNPFVFSWQTRLEALDLSDREIPLDLGYPRTVYDEVTVTWDPGIVVDSAVVPNTDSAVYVHGTCMRSFEIAADNLSARLITKIHSYQLPVAQFGDFKQHCRQARTLAGDYVKLHVADSD
ncbi:MAG: DUF3857 domain-containing protein [bacterium]